MPDLVRCEVVFTGRVQGVGFRYTAARLAQRCAVAGWVRNEPDGSVCCVVEGEQGEVDRFLNELRGAMAANIRSADITRSEATEEFTGFEIRQ